MGGESLRNVSGHSHLAQNCVFQSWYGAECSGKCKVVPKRLGKHQLENPSLIHDHRKMAKLIKEAGKKHNLSVPIT